MAFDLSGKLVYVNKLVETMLGYSVGYMLSKNYGMERVLTSPYNHFHAPLLRAMFQKGELPPLDVPCYNGHVVMLAGKSGKCVPVRLRWAVLYSTNRAFDPRTSLCASRGGARLPTVHVPH